ncbi:uncharacterized protein LOC141791795 [Halichoeres trimaculatus]|uniref:uncharacterized protein LOC141791795 n=1 Tax=Halichoeres trimaculatus TaxID=147232 RepID=UPI003D9EA0DB
MSDLVQLEDFIQDKYANLCNMGRSQKSKNPRTQDSPCSSTDSSPVTAPPTRCCTEVSEILLSIDSKFTNLDARIGIIEALHQEFQHLRHSLEFTQNQIEKITRENKDLQNSVSTMATELVTVQTQLAAVTAENKQMRESIKNITFHRVHRMRQKRTDTTRSRPIVAKFEHFKQKELVQRQGRQLRGTDRGLNDQYPPEIVRRRKALLSIRKQKISEGKRAALSVDKLYIDDVQLLMVKKEELPPEQQERSPYPDQEENESPLIKEEQEEVWIGQRREQLQGLEEADTKVLFPSVHMKSENDEEEPESSLLHHTLTDHMETAAGGEDCGRPEPARSSDPERNLQAEIEVKIEASSDSGSGTEDEEDEWKETRDCTKRLNWATTKGAETVKSHSCPKPGETNRVVSLTKQKPFICSECGKGFTRRGDVGRHMFVHMKEKPFSCSECGKRFNQKAHLTTHMSVHSKEKPFICSECGKRLKYKSSLNTHMSVHSKEKPFSCSKCGKRFSLKGHLEKHLFVHSKEKLFSCSECETRFKYKSSLTTHECLPK